MFSVLLPDPQVGESVVGPRTFITVQELLGISILQFVGHLFCGSMVGLMTTSSKKTYATRHASQVCCSQSYCPHSRPLLTHASAGDTQSLKGRSGSVSVGSLGPGVHKVLFEPSEHLWQVWGFDSKRDFTPPTILLGLLICPWMWSIFFWWDPTFS